MSSANGETVPLTLRALPYVTNASELIALHFRPFNSVIAHKPTKSLWKPTLKQQNVVYHIPCSDCPNVYEGQTGRQLNTSVQKHKGVVWRQNENSLFILHCLMASHVFPWDGASAMGKGTIAACYTTSPCGKQCLTLNPGYRGLREDWRRRRKAQPQISSNFNASAENHTHHASSCQLRQVRQ